MRFTEYNITYTTYWEGIYCLIFYIFVSFLFYDTNLLKNKRNIKDYYYNVNKYVLILFISIFAITDFADDDFYYYYLYLKNLAKYRITDLEKIYDIIIGLVKYDYWGFRIVIWGSASFFLYQIFRLNRLNLVHALYTFWVLYISIFSYARVTLGLSILFLGYTIYKKYHSYSFFGLTLIIISIFFHRTMIIPIIISLIPLIRWRKKSVLIIILIIPLLVFIVNLLISNYITDIITLLDETTSNKVGFYVNQQNKLNELTLVGLINYILSYLIFFVPIILFTRIIVSQKNTISNLELGMFQTSFILCILSIVLDLIDLPTTVLAYRIKYMTIIPITILLISFLDKKIIKLSQYRIIMLMGILYTSMKLISITRQALS